MSDNGNGNSVAGGPVAASMPEPPAAAGIDRNLPAIILALAAVAVVVAALLTPKFLSVDNLTAILRNAAIVGLVAVAMTPVTLSGNFVSLGISQSAMACMVAFVWLLGAGWPQPLAMLVVIAGSIAVGILQGVIVAGGLNPVITTLAAGAIIFGVASELTGGGIVQVRDNGASWGGKDFLGIPIEVLVFLDLHRCRHLADVTHGDRPRDRAGRRQPGDREDFRHFPRAGDDHRLRHSLGRCRHRRHHERGGVRRGDGEVVPDAYHQRHRRAAGWRHRNSGRRWLTVALGCRRRADFGDLQHDGAQ